ncbi:hypothetical protein RFN25_29860 [Mesorhizobium abyssinicae]|uniref:Uncharacterized protein n=1 Tax=Mesorhizobium abyssinicae TaxID=1209958 RepID=A0ABU5AX82_9HYPH|nr:hypothetical protein [Mesorhizobium abyssinicae]MDX8437615.1 hypothetical protein [Mesorhizobium abyssinicae]MDX8541826.1 hypothetical protein [Mesorhizobium abyssinicae]
MLRAATATADDAMREIGGQEMMKIAIEFYRTRDADDGHAVIRRETVEVDDLDGAVAAAQLLARTLDMPQHPGCMMITDANGKMPASSARKR